ncbi:HNH endonuclease [Egibacter rhizosphaerae]|uniref:HNH endonuclease n=1 Tax=Egibacter rhizosphaerae TaxID=1670831 RepID=A0A411YIZ2_9ACTN|nr:HNH endonuclease [Egibacter rhizosphaerae]
MPKRTGETSTFGRLLAGRHARYLVFLENRRSPLKCGTFERKGREHSVWIEQGTVGRDREGTYGAARPGFSPRRPTRRPRGPAWRTRDGPQCARRVQWLQGHDPRRTAANPRRAGRPRADAGVADRMGHDRGLPGEGQAAPLPLPPPSDAAGTHWRRWMVDRTPRRSELLREAQDLAVDSRTKLGFEVHEAADEMQPLQKPTRRPWLEDVVLDLLADQDDRCALCDGTLELDEHEVDHIVPFVYGGGNEQANIQLVHPRCNRSKGADIPPEALLRHLEDLHMNR